MDTVAEIVRKNGMGEGAGEEFVTLTTFLSILTSLSRAIWRSFAF